jgi:hypothetical protein
METVCGGRSVEVELANFPDVVFLVEQDNELKRDSGRRVLGFLLHEVFPGCGGRGHLDNESRVLGGGFLPRIVDAPATTTSGRRKVNLGTRHRTTSTSVSTVRHDPAGDREASRAFARRRAILLCRGVGDSHLMTCPCPCTISMVREISSGWTRYSASVTYSGNRRTSVACS